MRIGIPRESKAGETLVAATSATAAQLQKLGYDVVVESGAGIAADQPDSAFADAEITVGTAEDVWSSARSPASTASSAPDGVCRGVTTRHTPTSLAPTHVQGPGATWSQRCAA